MKQIAASQARKEWFRLLDEVLAGEVVVIPRRGRKVVLRRYEADEIAEPPPQYGALLAVPDADRADEWGWEWEEAEGELVPRGKEPG